MWFRSGSFGTPTLNQGSSLVVSEAGHLCVETLQTTYFYVINEFLWQLADFVSVENSSSTCLDAWGCLGQEMAGDQKYLENLEEAHRCSECREFSAAKNVQTRQNSY